MMFSQWVSLTNPLEKFTVRELKVCFSKEILVRIIIPLSPAVLIIPLHSEQDLQIQK